MRHCWEYEGSQKPPRRRRCALCGATGRRDWGGAWFTLFPGAREEVAGLTPCPGTPWVRCEASPDGPRWELWFRGRILRFITDEAIAREGRPAVEAWVAQKAASWAREIPPLPGEAWKALA